MPTDRVIDGLDIQPLMFARSHATSPRQTFFYYMSNRLEAVRHGRSKLHVGTKFGKEYRAIRELYDLATDPGESHNRVNDEPGIEAESPALLEACRQDLGDEATGVRGRRVRPIGRVPHPLTLTHHDPGHPYMVEEYDLTESE